MPIIVNLDVMMARRKISLIELSEKVGLTLDCQPADILEYREE
ncbi:MAG TPA: hypothetical protein VGS79_11475 [Puia sp.]|nr:hypothetical protein [Puia sp.]